MVLVTIFCPSSTSGVTTIEYEPGVLQDLKRIFNELVPANSIINMTKHGMMGMGTAI